MKDIESFLNLLASLDSSGFGGFSGDGVLSVSNTENLFSNVLQDSRKQILVALDEGEIKGYMSLFGNNVEMTKHRANVSLGIRDVVHQNRIGKDLLNAGIRWAGDNDIYRLELSLPVSRTNMIELYKTLGFLTEGERIDSLLIEGEYTNELYLYRLIN
ncbi:hypothetical protein AAT16_08535 [Salinicoccus halodurans]|nr:hypothetical protein AAT16_08535 [Salinicoccus halodurans]